MTTSVVGDKLKFMKLIESHIQHENGTFATPFLRLFGNELLDNKNSSNTWRWINIHKAFKLLNEDYMVHFYSWFVGAELFESFEKYLLECHQHGIINYIHDKYFPKRIKWDEEGPQVLTMFMLSAGFYLWLGSVVVAILTFIGEHIVRYYSKSRREFRKKSKKSICQSVPWSH